MPRKMFQLWLLVRWRDDCILIWIQKHWASATVTRLSSTWEEVGTTGLLSYSSRQDSLRFSPLRGSPSCLRTAPFSQGASPSLISSCLNCNQNFENKISTSNFWENNSDLILRTFLEKNNATHLFSFFTTFLRVTKFGLSNGSLLQHLTTRSS